MENGENFLLFVMRISYYSYIVKGQWRELYFIHKYTKFKMPRLAEMDTNGDGVIQPAEFDHSLAGNSTV